VAHHHGFGVLAIVCALSAAACGGAESTPAASGAHAAAAAPSADPAPRASIDCAAARAAIDTAYHYLRFIHGMKSDAIQARNRSKVNLASLRHALNIVATIPPSRERGFETPSAIADRWRRVADTAAVVLSAEHPFTDGTQHGQHMQQMINDHYIMSQAGLGQAIDEACPVSRR
jgi:hypothetical protein